MKLNQEIYFVGENLPMIVRATSERYAVASRKFNKKEDDEVLSNSVERGEYLSKDEAFFDLEDAPIYTLIDLKEGVRGASNHLFCLYDYFNNEECAEVIRLLEKGGMEISHRNRVELKIDLNKIIC